MSDILKRRESHFILWCPKPTSAPALIIGKIINGNPPALDLESRLPIPFEAVNGLTNLWQLDPGNCSLTDGQVYHYWIEVDDIVPGSRVQVTDPFAYCVDYRLLAPLNPSIRFPASVIQWKDGKLAACDPNGEKRIPVKAALEKIPLNNQLVIYELPAAWVRTSGSNAFERAVGTFRDVSALVDEAAEPANFQGLSATTGQRHLSKLGINALQLLPPADSIYAREWGYGTSHYLAPDYELGYPEGHLSPTSNQDLTDLVNVCHANGMRVILDVVMGFAKDEPYRYIDPGNFYIEDPEIHPGDPDAYNSRKGGGKEFRNPFGASCLRYVKTVDTYDPVSGRNTTISAARRHMITFLTRWMQDFQIDGVRIDSVENVANWDFIKEFRDEAHAQFRSRYGLPENTPGTAFIVIGEELSLPMELLTQNRIDALWNDGFRALIRAALIGQNVDDNERSFEQTVRKAIDCRLTGFPGGTKAVNYLTSHDVQDFRRERLYNYFTNEITREKNPALFNEGQIKTKMLDADPGLTAAEIQERADVIIEAILHTARLRRIKLGFVCLLTAVGIPMILAGEEFGDQHDLFDGDGQVSQEGGKQVDPVNFSRVEEPERAALFEYVAALVTLRKTHVALSADDIDFFHLDFEPGRRIMAWTRGVSDPVVVVANFSDFTTPGAPGPGTEYFIQNWPPTPAGQHWFEITQKRDIADGRHDREAIFEWEAKVYRLVPDSAI